VSLAGKPLKLNSPLDALKEGMAFVSEDRRGVGLLLDESIGLNIAFPVIQVKESLLKKILGVFTWKDGKKIKKTASDYIGKIDIKCTGPEQSVVELSGGNQQKVCVAKVLALSPRILFASEPTRGIDIGAKHLVLSVLRGLNEEYGTTIIMTSSEFGELRSICDRIAIISEGRVAGILPAEAPAEDFGLLMLGEVGSERGRLDA
jgi:simple sugar transport system ATP-binding protein